MKDSSVKEQGFLKYSLWAGLVFVVYLAAGSLGLKLDAIGGFATLIWAPTGIALVAILRLGPGVWPIIAAAAYLLNRSFDASPGLALAIATGNTLEALAGAYLLKRVAKFRPTLSRQRDVIALAVFGAFLSTVISATIGVESLHAFHVIDSTAMLRTWKAWWLGDMMGNLIVAPLLLVWLDRNPYHFNLPRFLEASLLFIVLSTLSFLLFMQSFPEAFNASLKPYFIFPVLLWAAIRFGQRGGTLSLFLVFSIAISLTAIRQASFASGGLAHELFEIQTFFAFTALWSLLLGAAAMEQQRYAFGHRQRRELLQYIDHMSTFNAKVTLDGRFLMVNRAAQIAAGLPYEELIRTNFLEGKWFTFDPEVHQRVKSAFARAASGEAVTYDEKIRIADGSVIYINFSLVPVYEGEEKISYILAEGRDINLQKQEEKKFRRLLEAAPDALVITDELGKIVLVNQQVRQVFGYSAGELEGKEVEALVSEPYREKRSGLKKDYFLDPRAFPIGMRGGELLGLRKDGTEFPAIISLSPMETKEGRLTIMAIRDISDQKRAEAERIKLVQAQEAIRIRDEFFSVASHELRTPIMPLRLYLQMAENVQDRDKRADLLIEKLPILSRQVDRLVRLIDGLLDVTRIASGKLKLELSEMNLVEVIEDVVERYQAEAQQTGAMIRFEHDGEVHGCWDSLRIEQVITNLLSNAVRYGDGRPIDVHVGSAAGKAIIRVEDHGIGIPPEDLTRVFNRFEQSVTKKSYGGLGLGLYITRQIVEAHGGCVKAGGKPGKGAVFTVELPMTTDRIASEVSLV